MVPRNRWVRAPQAAKALGEHPPVGHFGPSDIGANTNVIGHAGREFGRAAGDLTARVRRSYGPRRARVMLRSSLSMATTTVTTVATAKMRIHTSAPIGAVSKTVFIAGR